MNEYYKNEHCRISGQKDLVLVIPFKKFPYCDSYLKEKQDRKTYPMGVYFSPSSGLLQLADVLNPKVIYRDYIYKTSNSVGLNRHFINFAENLTQKLKLEPESFIFEIGPNDGILLNAFKLKGMHVLGIDPDKQAIEDAKIKYNVDIIEDFFNEETALQVKKEHGQPNIILANNIVANVDDLHGFVKGIKHLLVDNGLFIFETSYIVGLLENMVFDSMYHEHLCYFGLKPIEYLFEQHDMQVCHVEKIETKGGSLRTYIKHKDFDYPIDHSVQKLREEEEDKKIYDPQTYKDFFQKIEQEKQALLSFLKQAQKEGKIITAYGAADSTTTLFGHFEVTEYIECIFDDNELKIGTFAPIDNIPVLDSQEIYNINPDYIILSAWRFKEYILKRHPNCKATFIMPLPKFDILY